MWALDVSFAAPNYRRYRERNNAYQARVCASASHCGIGDCHSHAISGIDTGLYPRRRRKHRAYFGYRGSRRATGECSAHHRATFDGRSLNRPADDNPSTHHGAAPTTRHVTRVTRGRWVRPSRYWWRPGGAIAAGAAIGFVSAATAAAWAGAAPGPNMSWYYSDSSRTEGFWDVCPK